MKFGAIDYRMASCKAHLDATNAWKTEIETFLVQYLLVSICAEIETRIPVMFERRCSRGTDAQLIQFAIKQLQYVTKHFSVSELGLTLKKFDDGYYKQFNSSVMLDNSHVAWDSIYSNRQSVAHGSGVQMTFNDLTIAYQDCLPVLDALVATLGLTPDETKDFV
jgi:hypothetical protein